MNFEEIYKSAETECGYLKDNECTKIYVSSSISNVNARDVLDTFQAEAKEKDLKSVVIQTGSFGYYDLEPIVRIEKPGQSSVLYKNVNPEKVSELVEDYLINDNPRQDIPIPTETHPPLFDLENRIALRNCGYIEPENVNHYILLGQGYSGLSKALKLPQEGVIEEVKKSGLRGRGGAGFDTAKKWHINQNAEKGDRYVVCNAIDADRLSKTAQLLLESDPHSVIEGMLIGAYAIGAAKCIICVNKEYNSAIQSLGKAIDQLKEYNLIGNNILDTPFHCDLEIKEVDTSLVSGEETALLCSMEGKQVMPYIRPPFPSAKGFEGKPTVINNIETLANVSAIFQNGAVWFTRVGTKESKGTKVITLSGDVTNSYTVEVEFGTDISDILNKIGHGVPEGKTIKAVQLGGPTGAYFPVDSLDISIDYETILKADSIIGSGTIEVLTNDSCAVEICRNLISYIHSQSCGKCVFCREGTYQISDILNDIVEKSAGPEVFDILIELGETMKTGCICGLGRTAPNPVLSSIRLFRDEYDLHIREKMCSVNGNG